MKSWDKNAKNWDYRGEGNFHVIIAHKTNKVVLRLPKRYKDPEQRKSDSLSSKFAAENEISFQRNIVFPLLYNCSRICYPSTLVTLTTEFLIEIEELLEHKRPAHRQHKEIDKDCNLGILLPDFCQVLPEPPGMEKHKVNICIEIKPKMGFLNKNTDGVCTYCRQQTYKLKRGTYRNVSNYCPLDLFSGSKTRMLKALKALIEDPQNNLRVFRNGETIFSEDKRRASHSMSPMELISSTISGLITTEPGAELHILLQAIYKILLKPLVLMRRNSKHYSQNCKLSDVKEKIFAKQNACKSIPDINGDFKETNMDSSLPVGCILDLILNIQKLQSQTLNEYNNVYKKVKESCSAVGAKQSFDSLQWKKIVEQNNNHCIKNHENHDLSYVQLLQEFLIATSFKDCSILISLQQDNEKDSSLNVDISDSNYPLHIKCDNETQFWASLAIIDCDPKPTSRIPHYVALEAESTNTMEDYMKSLLQKDNISL